MEHDLFPGFDRRFIDVNGVRIFVRTGGTGRPLVLIHGCPQSHLMWHAIAPRLAEAFSVVLVDLRGYGASGVVEDSTNGSHYSKRQMASDVIGVMDALGHGSFAVVGHDRGARVGYRLALDHGERVTKLALLDIVPTLEMWEGMDARKAMQVYHWLFFAQPAPLPETLISASPDFFINYSLASLTADRSLSAYHPVALDGYRRSMRDAVRVHSMCEDYRAGASLDLEHDRHDLAHHKVITCRTLVLWGNHGVPSVGRNARDVWRETFAPHATGSSIDAGHFLAEESPGDTLQKLLPFLVQDAQA